MNLQNFTNNVTKNYSDLYENRDIISREKYNALVQVGEYIVNNCPQATKLIADERGDFFSSDREFAALAMAFEQEGLVYEIDDGNWEVPMSDNDIVFDSPKPKMLYGIEYDPSKTWQPTLEEFQNPLRSSFDFSKDIDTIIIPEGVKSLDKSMLDSIPLHSPVSSIILPESLKTIADNTFSGTSLGSNCIHEADMENLPDEYDPKGVTMNLDFIETIGRNALIDEHGLSIVNADSLVNFPQSLKNIESADLKNLFVGPNTEQILSEAIKEIDANARLYGFSDLEKAEILIAARNNGIELNDTNIKHMNKAAHQGPKQLEDYLRNYKHKGNLDCDFKFADTTKAELSKAFLEKFPRTPKILDSLAVQSTQYNVPSMKIVEAFDVKRMAEAREKNIPDMIISSVMTAMPKNEFDKAMGSPYRDEIAQECCNYFKYNDENYLHAAYWITNHPQTNRELIEQIVSNAEYLDINIDSSVDKVRSEISKAGAVSEIEAIERAYSDTGFKFEDCQFDLKFCDVELGNYKASILKPGDTRMATLGQDTHCCQHLGGAGETAMMYGLANPNAGFWVIEDKDSGKILAQAEIWVTDDRIPIPGDVLNFDDPSLKHDFESWLTDFVNNGWVESCDCSIAEHMNYCMGEDRYNEAVSEDLGTIMITNMDAVLDFIDGNEYAKESFLSYCSEYGFEHDGEEHFLTMTNDGEIRAFEGYTSDKESLVFDNIEFADDRQIEQFTSIIGKWCEKCDYDNVLMGNGYNELRDKDIRQTGGIKPPLDGHMAFILDKGLSIQDTDVMEECLSGSGTLDDIYNWYEEAMRPDTFDINRDELLYTDADRSCSVLKVDGKVEPYFEKAHKNALSQEHKQDQSQSAHQNKKIYADIDH